MFGVIFRRRYGRVTERITPPITPSEHQCDVFPDCARKIWKRKYPNIEYEEVIIDPAV